VKQILGHSLYHVEHPCLTEFNVTVGFRHDEWSSSNLATCMNCSVYFCWLVLESTLKDGFLFCYVFGVLVIVIINISLCNSELCIFLKTNFPTGYGPSNGIESEFNIGICAVFRLFSDSCCGR
jgi:hypothetical protein